MDTIAYDFDPAKNTRLIEVRGISFEQIITILENKGPIDVIEHPNRRKYPNQKIYIIELLDYIYMVPFVEQGEKIFLKTAFPNRKAVKKYANQGDDHG
jgi:uncharacterized DUF497 family protein